MSAHGVPDTVQKMIIVRCSLETAFRIWTTQLDLWWPKQHSRSGDPNTSVTLEGFHGGRLYERTPGGVEHVWGAVTAWEPPYLLGYHWYLGSGAAQPSHVEVRFSAEGGFTRVMVTHRGPELLGERWAGASSIFDTAWAHVLLAYGGACQAEREET